MLSFLHLNSNPQTEKEQHSFVGPQIRLSASGQIGPLNNVRRAQTQASWGQA